MRRLPRHATSDDVRLRQSDSKSFNCSSLPMNINCLSARTTGIIAYSPSECNQNPSPNYRKSNLVTHTSVDSASRNMSVTDFVTELEAAILAAGGPRPVAAANLGEAASRRFPSGARRPAEPPPLRHLHYHLEEPHGGASRPRRAATASSTTFSHGDQTSPVGTPKIPSREV